MTASGVHQPRAPYDPVLLHSVNRRSPPETAGEVPQHETAGVNAGDRFDLQRRLTARHRNGDRALVPRPIRSGATPHDWIVADAIAGRTSASRPKRSSALTTADT